MDRLFENNQKPLFLLLCKLEGLYIYTEENQFYEYRRTVFECLNIIGELIKICQEEKI